MNRTHFLRRHMLPIVVLVVALCVAIGLVVGRAYFGLFVKDPLQNGPVVVDAEAVADAAQPSTVPFVVTPVVQGLYVPWSLVFTSEDRWLVSERSGAIRIVQNGQLQTKPLTTFNEVSTGSEEGLMGLALDPDYAANKLVYACYATKTAAGLIDKVVRFTDNGEDISQPQTIIDSIPSAKNHAGCRLGFGPDRKLYVTTGDATEGTIAQDIASLGGKILRVNADGSVPDNNPFAGSPIWSFGHRNSQGIAWQPNTDQLFATEHGPSLFDGPAGGDEVNHITKGGNYGWPIVSHERTDPRFVSPLIVFTPAVAPGGAVFYTSKNLPQFTNNLFFAGLKGEGLYRAEFAPDNPAQVAQYEKLPGVDVGRIRDVVQSPDGDLYFLTSNRDGRGSVRQGDDKIYKLTPEE